MTRITVGGWWKSLAVRFPGDIARAAGLTEGERVKIETRGREIVLRRVVMHFTIEELFRGRSPEGVAGGVCGRLRLAAGRWP
jgi:antitoxin component of MazEF toxin-antitoxin module